MWVIRMMEERMKVHFNVDVLNHGCSGDADWGLMWYFYIKKNSKNFALHASFVVRHTSKMYWPIQHRKKKTL